jgi:hypothetical protein
VKFEEGMTQRRKVDGSKEDGERYSSASENVNREVYCSRNSDHDDVDDDDEVGLQEKERRISSTTSTTPTTLSTTPSRGSSSRNTHSQQHSSGKDDELRFLRTFPKGILFNSIISLVSQTLELEGNIVLTSFVSSKTYQSC